MFHKNLFIQTFSLLVPKNDWVIPVLLWLFCTGIKSYNAIYYKLYSNLQMFFVNRIKRIEHLVLKRPKQIKNLYNTMKKNSI